VVFTANHLTDSDNTVLLQHAMKEKMCLRARTRLDRQ